MKINAIFLFLCIMLFSCTKDKNSNLVLNGTLTDCAANTTCTYNYYDHANFINGYQVVAGNFKVFSYKSVSVNLCGATSSFYFKTSLNNNDININSAQIAAGQVTANSFSCPCCYNAVFEKVIGGEIKGKKIDSDHWLINASIIFGTSVNNPADTMVVNQYFTSAKLP